MATVGRRSTPHPARRFRLAVANVSIFAGLALTLAVAVVFAYGLIEEQRFAVESEQRRAAFEQEQAALTHEQEDQYAQGEQPATELAPPAQADAEAMLRQLTREQALMPEEPSVTILPTATPTPRPARRIVIPRIGVDSEVVESEIKNGEWLVPKFVVGHLESTAQPGERGNSVYSGHVQSISSGNVFARIPELKAGDRITIYTVDRQYTYEVTNVKVVANTDLSVVQPTEDETATLITCSGTWDFRTRDYLERTIIIAKLRSQAAMTKTATTAR